VDAVALDDFEGVLSALVAALVAAGMDETAAWPGPGGWLSWRCCGGRLGGISRRLRMRVWRIWGSARRARGRGWPCWSGPGGGRGHRCWRWGRRGWAVWRAGWFRSTGTP